MGIWLTVFEHQILLQPHQHTWGSLIIYNSHGNRSLYLFLFATTIFLANAMSSGHGVLLSVSSICYNNTFIIIFTTPKAKTSSIILVGSHIKLLLKASHLCILVNPHECGNGCLQLMRRHTCVPTCDVVTEGIMDEYILILQDQQCCRCMHVYVNSPST